MDALVLNWGQTDRPYEITSLTRHAKDLFFLSRQKSKKKRVLIQSKWYLELLSWVKQMARAISSVEELKLS